MSETERGQATGAIRKADVLIIGGGLSGTMLAVQLLRLPGARQILLIEPRAELGRGEAYSAVELGHTLNGNAARMSVDPDNADDLTHWLTEYIAAGGWPESDQQHVPVSELFPPRGSLACTRNSVWPRPGRDRRQRWSIFAPRSSTCRWSRPVCA